MLKQHTQIQVPASSSLISNVGGKTDIARRSQRNACTALFRASTIIASRNSLRAQCSREVTLKFLVINGERGRDLLLQVIIDDHLFPRRIHFLDEIPFNTFETW